MGINSCEGRNLLINISSCTIINFHRAQQGDHRLRRKGRQFPSGRPRPGHAKVQDGADAEDPRGRTVEVWEQVLAGQHLPAPVELHLRAVPDRGGAGTHGE